MKRIISVFLIFIMLFTTVFAASNAQNQLNQTNKDIKNAKNQLTQIKKDKKNTLTEIDNLDKQITTTESTIASLESEIKSLESAISIAEDNIDYMQKQYDKKNDIRKRRAATYYENGSISYWEMLLNSESISDFMYRKQIIDDVMKYDNDLLNDLEKDQEIINVQKAELENNKIVCQNKKVEAQEKKSALDETKVVRTEYLAELNKSEDVLSDSIDELQKKADALVAQIRAASSTNTKYTGGTMAWPLPGYYGISSPFGNRLHPVLKVYKMHTGIDIAGAGCNGKNITAAADGTVITAGWISGYGNTVVVDHGGGITTLYAHAQKILVKKGDKVNRGDALSLVGMTGYATGLHLHFEVRENGKYVNPLDGYLKK